MGDSTDHVEEPKRIRAEQYLAQHQTRRAGNQALDDRIQNRASRIDELIEQPQGRIDEPIHATQSIDKRATVAPERLGHRPNHGFDYVPHTARNRRSGMQRAGLPFSDDQAANDNYAVTT